MKYRLTVEQFSENALYDAELKEYADKTRYGYSGQLHEMPQRQSVVKVLSVEVTDVEFAAIKKAALATMA